MNTVLYKVNCVKRLVNFYKGKRVLVTGHTGFKGSFLTLMLHELGAKVSGLSLNPETSRDNFVLAEINKLLFHDFRCDIRNYNLVKECFESVRPEVVFHLAAQPLVRRSYIEPEYTWQVNVMGTINVLNALRTCKESKYGVFITSDKCYENQEVSRGYCESDALGGFDPYSSSKGAAEIAISSWRRSFLNPKNGKVIASCRAGNVIGGGDWSADRIVPDCIRALESSVPIRLRNPHAVRPFQHVFEPLSGYLLIGEKLAEDPIKYGDAWNFGPEAQSTRKVDELVKMLLAYWGEGMVEYPDNSMEPHEANLLTLDISKAKNKLGWFPRWNFEKTVAMTAQWYHEYHKGKVLELDLQQLTEFWCDCHK